MSFAQINLPHWWPYKKC